jgi:hypothetical protein
MLRAARAVAASAVDLLMDAGLRRAAREEIEAATAGRRYLSPLPAGKGPFDYLPRPH